jgi:hypothetical protein
VALLALLLSPEVAVSTDGPGYFELLEHNSQIIYPALAILALVLIVAGILQAWRSQDLAGLEKAELKREIILHLRKQLGGSSTGEELARALGVTPLQMNKLLEEMYRDGVLQNYTNTQHLKVWKVKGVGGPPRNSGESTKSTGRKRSA